MLSDELAAAQAERGYRAESAQKPKEQPPELRELADRVDRYIQDAFADAHRRSRVERGELLLKFLDSREHWENQTRAKDGDEWWPRLDFAAAAVRRAVPRVLNQPMRPSVTAEADASIDASPPPELTELASQLQTTPTGASRVLAALLQAPLEHYRERAGLDRATADAVRKAAKTGEAYIVDAYDDQPTADVLLLDDVIFDPSARRFEDVRYAGYRFLRTVGHLRRHYPEWAHLVSGSAESMKSGSGTRKINTDAERDPSRRNVEIWCVFLRDESTREVEVEDEVPAEEVLQLQMAGEAVEPIYEMTETGASVMVAGRVIRVEQQRVFPSGWRRVYWAERTVLADGSAPEDILPEGCALPIHQIRCYPMDNCLHGVGVADAAIDPNLIADAALKYTMEDASEGAATFMRDTALDSAQGLQPVKGWKGRSKAYAVRSTYEGSLGDIFWRNPAPEASLTLKELLPAMQQVTEHVTGLFDPRTLMQGKTDPASGALIERMEDGAATDLGPFQESVIAALEGVCRNWLHYLLSYEGEVKAYRVKSALEERVIRLAPAALAEFDAKFDIKIGSGGRLPRDPREAGEYMINLTDSLMGKPKPVRDAQLRMLDLPFADELIGVLDAAEQAMQAAAPPPEPPPPDPAVEEARKASAKSVADFLEGIATGENYPMGLRVAAAEALTNAIQTGVYDLSKVSLLMGAPLAPPQAPPPQVLPPEAGEPIDPTMGGAVPPEVAALAGGDPGAMMGGMPPEADMMDPTGGMVPPVEPPGGAPF